MTADDLAIVLYSIGLFLSGFSIYLLQFGKRSLREFIAAVIFCTFIFASYMRYLKPSLSHGIAVLILGIVCFGVGALMAYWSRLGISFFMASKRKA